MTLRRDVGQLLWIGIEGPALSEPDVAGLAAGDAGVVVLFKRNLVASGDQLDVPALVDLCRAIRGADAAEPIAIAVDQEGGTVQRVRAPAPAWPAMGRFAALAEADAAALAESVGRAIGDELAALGFDIDFAPVLDVHTNPANPVIGERAFATEPEAVAVRALAFARGLHAAGIVGCGKHYPGHGDTRSDSHHELPRLDHDLDRLRRVELLPFARAAAAGIPMIMTAHVVFEALDPGVPATLSRRAIEELLRGELGYAGVIVSDDLDMKAISDNVGVGEAAVRAVEAGCDALLLCRDRANQDAAREALIRAAESSAVLRARIAGSAARVRALKRAHLPRRRELDPGAAMAVLTDAAHHDLARRLAGA